MMIEHVRHECAKYQKELRPFITHKFKFIENLQKDCKKCLLLDAIHTKVEKIQEDSLDLISSPSPSMKIQIIDGKGYLR